MTRPPLTLHRLQPRLAPIVLAFAALLAGFPQGSRAQDKPSAPKSARPDSKLRQKTASSNATDPAVIDRQAFQSILDKYKGKPLLINFWATWCEPCREEYPMLNELAKKYAPQGLQVVGISLDDDREMILVRRFLARNKPIFQNFRKRPGKEEEFINAIDRSWTGAIPASFFYARDGRQLGQIFGEGKLETYEAAIRSLLASGAKTP